MDLEGAWADMCILDLDQEWNVGPENILYKCGWSPLNGRPIRGKVTGTIVSGHLAWHDSKLNESKMGERLSFNR